MMAEREEGLLGAVARRAEAVGAEADPRQERDQREAMEDFGIANVARRSDQNVAQRAFARFCAASSWWYSEPLVGDVIRAYKRSTTMQFANVRETWTLRKAMHS